MRVMLSGLEHLDEPPCEPWAYATKAKRQRLAEDGADWRYRRENEDALSARAASEAVRICNARWRGFVAVSSEMRNPLTASVPPRDLKSTPTPSSSTRSWSFCCRAWVTTATALSASTIELSIRNKLRQRPVARLLYRATDAAASLRGIWRFHGVAGRQGG